MIWYEKKGASTLLRFAGVGILATAWFAGTVLRSRVGTVSPNGDPVAYLLAAATFLCGSVGSLLAVLGNHIFDKVPVSRRWSRIDGN